MTLKHTIAKINYGKIAGHNAKIFLVNWSTERVFSSSKFLSQMAFTYSKLKIETLEQSVKYVQS